MAEQILRWRGEFAYVVIDTAPILPVSDAIALTPNVDAVILVVRFAVTTRQAVTRCIRILKTTRVNRLAVLVNDMDVRSPEFYHYSGSKGYAGYHYGETSEDTILVREDARQNTERKIS
jgi:Mrp family chromosome partitioning ATPase